MRNNKEIINQEPLTEDGTKIYEFLKELKGYLKSETEVDLKIKLYKSLNTDEYYTCVIDISKYEDHVFEGYIRRLAKAKIQESKSRFGRALLDLEEY